MNKKLITEGVFCTLNLISLNAMDTPPSRHGLIISTSGTGRIRKNDRQSILDQTLFTNCTIASSAPTPVQPQETPPPSQLLANDEENDEPNGTINIKTITLRDLLDFLNLKNESDMSSESEDENNTIIFHDSPVNAAHSANSDSESEVAAFAPRRKKRKPVFPIVKEWLRCATAEDIETWRFDEDSSHFLLEIIKDKANELTPEDFDKIHKVIDSTLKQPLRELSLLSTHHIDPRQLSPEQRRAELDAILTRQSERQNAIKNIQAPTQSTPENSKECIERFANIMPVFDAPILKKLSSSGNDNDPSVVAANTFLEKKDPQETAVQPSSTMPTSAQKPCDESNNEQISWQEALAMPIPPTTPVVQEICKARELNDTLPTEQPPALIPNVPQIIICNAPLWKRMASLFIPGYYSQSTTLATIQVHDNELAQTMKINQQNLLQHQQTVGRACIMKTIVNGFIVWPLAYRAINPFVLRAGSNYATALTHLFAISVAGSLSYACNKASARLQYNAHWDSIHKQIQ